MAQVLRHLPPVTDPNLLVGINTGDDAAVYKLSDELSLILTLDFFPPIVDEPFAFGEIAVANALSDVYAMGGKPILALNIVGFPVELPKDILGKILQGGASKASEAGVLVVGGHTVDDKEPKYGMSVTGIVEPGHHVSNAGAQVGDVLVLTKPIGTGIITTAGKAQVVSDAVLSNAISIMGTLNKLASDAMVNIGVNACTDVTGFGLIGHLRGMVEASQVAARINVGAVPLLDGVWQLLEDGIAPGGTHRNLDSVDGVVGWDSSFSELTRLLMCDAQTSGGLLISVAKEKESALLAELEKLGVECRAVIGEIVDQNALTDGHVIDVLA